MDVKNKKVSQSVAHIISTVLIGDGLCLKKIQIQLEIQGYYVNSIKAHF